MGCLPSLLRKMEDQFITQEFSATDLQIRAAVNSKGIDVENRTFSMVIATENPVVVFDYRKWEEVNQTLVCTKEACDISRLVGSGISFNRIHPTICPSSMLDKNTIGQITAVRFVGKECHADVQFTKVADPDFDRVWNQIVEGTLRGVSVGFKPKQIKFIETEDGQRNEQIVEKWEFMESSLADVAADGGAAIQRAEAKPDNFQTPHSVIVRSAYTPKVKTEISQNRNMEKKPEQIAAELAIRNAELETQARNATEQLAKLERENQIRTIVTEANVIATRSGMEAVTAEQTTAFLTSTQSPEQVRAAINATWAAADPNKGASGGARSGADREQFQERAELAMMVRVGAIEGAEITPQIKEQTRDFMGMTDIRMFEEFAKRNGYQGHDSQKIFDVAMHKPGHVDVRSGGSMIGADLPSLLENVLNKRLIKQLALRQPTWSQWADTDATFVDFKPKAMVSLGDMPPLVAMGELDDYTYGATKDGKETMTVGRFGRGIMFSYEMVVNNELGGILSRTPRGFAQRISQKRNETCYGALLNNPVMADGNQLFSSAHANICTAASLNAANFQIAKRKLRNQKSLGTPTEAGMELNLAPKYLIVGPSLEVTADVLMNAQFTPNTISDVNTARGQAKVIVDSLITDDSWYLVGDYMDCDHIVMGFMQGWDLGIRMDRSWKNDAYDFHVSEIHGVGVLDHKNLVYTPSL